MAFLKPASPVHSSTSHPLIRKRCSSPLIHFSSSSPHRPSSPCSSSRCSSPLPSSPLSSSSSSSSANTLPHPVVVTHAPTALHHIIQTSKQLQQQQQQQGDSRGESTSLSALSLPRRHSCGSLPDTTDKKHSRIWRNAGGVTEVSLHRRTCQRAATDAKIADSRDRQGIADYAAAAQVDTHVAAASTSSVATTVATKAPILATSSSSSTTTTTTTRQLHPTTRFSFDQLQSNTHRQQQQQLNNHRRQQTTTPTTAANKAIISGCARELAMPQQVIARSANHTLLNIRTLYESD